MEEDNKSKKVANILFGARFFLARVYNSGPDLLNKNLDVNGFQVLLLPNPNNGFAPSVNYSEIFKSLMKGMVTRLYKDILKDNNFNYHDVLVSVFKNKYPDYAPAIDSIFSMFEVDEIVNKEDRRIKITLPSFFLINNSDFLVVPPLTPALTSILSPDLKVDYESYRELGDRAAKHLITQVERTEAILKSGDHSNLPRAQTMLLTLQHFSAFSNPEFYQNVYRIPGPETCDIVQDLVDLFHEVLTDIFLSPLPEEVKQEIGSKIVTVREFFRKQK